jgi:glycosyltransferase involved in cell wall biosynthesis
VALFHWPCYKNILENEQADDSRIRMLLIGPDNAHIQELKNRGSLPENIVFSGYAPSPSEALARANMVLNLSNFEETFGRTVLEAMAAGRPFPRRTSNVLLSWKALPTGFVCLLENWNPSP